MTGGKKFEPRTRGRLKSLRRGVVPSASVSSGEPKRAQKHAPDRAFQARPRNRHTFRTPSARATPDEYAGTEGIGRLLALYRPDIFRALTNSGAPAYRSTQVFEHLLRRSPHPFADSTVLPTDMRRILDGLGASTLTVSGTRCSSDKTTKLLMTAHDDSAIETVIMRYANRTTACISTQVGCPVGCTFCATGSLGFRRNLSAAEIVDQVRAASDILVGEQRRLSNLVFMGMGEPLLNLQAVLDSIRILGDSRGSNLARRAFSISTVGIPSGIRRLARAEPQVNLALSLHAADDRTRALLIPEKFRHPLATILEAAWEHFDITGRKLLVEYVLLGGVNDAIADAKRLAVLLRGHVVTINLLAWNPVPPTGNRQIGCGRLPEDSEGTRLHFDPPTSKAIAAFRNALLDAHIDAVVRQSRGSEIQAACGQLAARELSSRTGRSSGAKDD